MDKEVRVIQYLGSKLKILDEIEKEINALLDDNSIVCDLFSGSGVVAQRLAKKNTVYANDVQKYSSMIADVLLCCERVKDEEYYSYYDIINSSYYKHNLSKLQSIFKTPLEYEKTVIDSNNYEQLAELCELNLFYDGSELEEEKSIKAKALFGDAFYLFNQEHISELKNDDSFYALFSMYYLNSYFSLRQCIEIDSIRFALDKMLSNKEITLYQHKLLLVCLMHSISEIVSSVGKNFAQPIKVTSRDGRIKDFAIKRCMRDRSMKIGQSFDAIREVLVNLNVQSDGNRTFCADAHELLKTDDMKKVSVFYLDPPYTIDHYSRFYHVLETLVEYDYPELEKKKLSGRYRIMNGKYRNDRYQSKFCIPSKGLDEFEKIISSIKSIGASIVLSYSEDDSSKDTRKRVVTKDDLVNVLGRHYRDIKVKNVEHRYRKLSTKKSNRKEMSNSELLIICK